MRGRSTMPMRDAVARGSGRPMLQCRRSGTHVSRCEAKQFSSGRLPTERHPTTNRYDCSCTRDAKYQPPASHHQSTWMLILRCPRCEHRHEDEFDVLDADALGSMKCGGCRNTFWFAVMECHRCAHEEAFEWASTLSESDLSLLACRACCRTFRHHEDSSDQEIEAWT